MKSLMLAIVCVLTFFSTAQADQILSNPTEVPKLDCTDCRSTTVQQRCVLAFEANGYSGGRSLLMQLCSNIQTRPALQCIRALTDNRYQNIGQEITDACSVTTDCGERAVHALFWNRYTNLAGSFIRFVAGTRSEFRADCMVNVFNQRYNNLTVENLSRLCPN